MPTSNNILASLTKVAGFFVEQMKRKIEEVKAPTAIGENTTIDPAQETNEGCSIDIVIKHGAAMAFEYGSGIHGKKGEKYIIEPTKRAALAFEWEEAKNISPSNPYIPIPSAPRLTYSRTSGRIMLPYVMHPGVAPRPYVHPTIEENKEEMKKILGQGFKAMLMEGKKPIEIIEVKG
jgi:hypothetical protein